MERERLHQKEIELDCHLEVGVRLHKEMVEVMVHPLQIQGSP